MTKLENIIDLATAILIPLLMNIVLLISINKIKSYGIIINDICEKCGIISILWIKNNTYVLEKLGGWTLNSRIIATHNRMDIINKRKKSMLCWRTYTSTQDEVFQLIHDSGKRIKGWNGMSRLHRHAGSEIMDNGFMFS